MLAQGITNPAIGTLGNPGSTGGIFLSKGIPAAIGLAFVIGALIFFVMLVMGAIQWISSGGDKQALEGARGRITSALIGLVLLFAAFAIIRFIQNFFGISILTLDIGSLVIQ
jgi:hypothetical protein